MPGPQLLYVVTSVVVLGLVAWVIAVLSRPAAAAPPPPSGEAGAGPASPPSP